MKGNRSFVLVSALLFLASAAVTVYWCNSMTGGMHMPGGWTMSMAWMKMPGQSWPAATVSFLGMWTIMMAAMMLPSLVPELLHYRRLASVNARAALNRLTALAATGYFFVWILIGAAIYPVGVSVARAEMQSQPLARSVPLIAGALLLLAGCFQLTRWKRRCLCLCRGESTPHPPRADGLTAWRYGLRLGANCGLCCLGFMSALLVVGVMNLTAMAAITLAITVERLAPNPKLAARVIAAFFAVAGAWQIVRVSL